MTSTKEVMVPEGGNIRTQKTGEKIKLFLTMPKMVKKTIKVSKSKRATKNPRKRKLPVSDVTEKEAIKGPLCKKTRANYVQGKHIVYVPAKQTPAPLVKTKKGGKTISVDSMEPTDDKFNTLLTSMAEFLPPEPATGDIIAPNDADVVKGAVVLMKFLFSDMQTRKRNSHVRKLKDEYLEKVHKECLGPASTETTTRVSMLPVASILI
ncbi:hypothetical protein ABW20_dc0101776 [Dactylellina cionopaga]|nr:hypothetical protein ABW20_dc0101776 [Dactylellina cionopaga]